MDTNEIKKEVEMKDMIIKHGDIFFADLSPAVGAEIGGLRYVVVIQNDELNDEACLNGGSVIIAPMSSNKIEVGNRTAMATIPVDIPELSLFSYRILLFGIRAIDTKRLKEHIGHLKDETIEELDKQLQFVLNITK